MSKFLGSHAINMDAKGRLAIPARVREELAQACSGRIVLTANAPDTEEERCLLIYPEPQWEALRPEIEALPNMNRRARRLQRLMLGYATPLELDSVGRVLVPPTLRDYARFEKKLMVIGQGKKLELWNEERWFAWLDEASADDDMPPEMEALSL
ncbi:division/cell wall cluster transcriptional repressor MraZ [Marinobacter caseinilyticus]|uniref:division/cell wall cluster transcriptional repressor MraZ n=1 Tax=Marinobacter caseinilyticus TaxID=2692195 RepID=UPI00140A3C80|nr:division/cell wall cluster transcriptional repressor MraZ [Marinobacter caseinilyticus]